MNASASAPASSTPLLNDEPDRARPGPIRSAQRSLPDINANADADTDASTADLSRFFESGIISSSWEAFNDPRTTRIVFIGTDVANLYHLVRNNELPKSNSLHYPFSVIQEELPWIPKPGLSRHSYITADIINDLKSCPTRPVRDALVDTYFTDIHPGFPIIDRAKFYQQYMDPKDPPPLLIFNCVLLAAARISDHPMVAASRLTVTATLYRRAKALFDVRYENDRLNLVQAALLLASHTENADTVGSNAYYWVGTAVRTAFGLGMHRGGLLGYHLPCEAVTIKLYRKVWWSLVHAEVFLALEFGRPCMIRAEDFDTAGLTDDDFNKFDGSGDETVNRDFCEVMANLCLLVLDILNQRAVRSKEKEKAANNSAIDNRLAEIGFLISPRHDFWSCQLRINYHLVVLILNRTRKEPDTSSLCSEAASNILTTFESMVVQGTIRQCHQSSSTALVAAAIQFSKDVESALAKNSVMTAVSAHAQLQRLLAPAEALSNYWPNIVASCRLFKSLSARAEILIKGRQHANANVPSEMDITWQDIMPDYQMPDLGSGLGVEDWMNSFSSGSLFQ